MPRDESQTCTRGVGGEYRSGLVSQLDDVVRSTEMNRSEGETVVVGDPRAVLSGRSRMQCYEC